MPIVLWACHHGCYQKNPWLITMLNATYLPFGSPMLGYLSPFQALYYVFLLISHEISPYSPQAGWVNGEKFSKPAVRHPEQSRCTSSGCGHSYGKQHCFGVLRRQPKLRTGPKIRVIVFVCVASGRLRLKMCWQC